MGDGVRQQEMVQGGGQIATATPTCSFGSGVEGHHRQDEHPTVVVEREVETGNVHASIIGDA